MNKKNDRLFVCDGTRNASLWFGFKKKLLRLSLVLVTLAANLAADAEIRIASALFLECTSTTSTTHLITLAPRLGHVQSLRPQRLYWSGKEFHARRRRGQISREVRDEERLGRFYFFTLFISASRYCTSRWKNGTTERRATCWRISTRIPR
jgi:hypothetical protein